MINGNTSNDGASHIWHVETWTEWASYIADVFRQKHSSLTRSLFHPDTLTVYVYKLISRQEKVVTNWT